jgi:hypothetical protein
MFAGITSGHTRESQVKRVWALRAAEVDHQKGKGQSKG